MLRPASLMSGPTQVVVIENDAALVSSMRTSLRGIGCEITAVAPQAGDAAQMVSDQTEVLLLDLESTGVVEGLRTAQQLRKKFSFPIVFLGGDEGATEEGKRVVTSIHLAKPFSPRELQLAVEGLRRQHVLETQVRQMESKMLEAQKLETLGLMAGGLAHEFNNLLTAILGSVAIGRHEIPQGTPGLSRLDHVEKAAARAAELCQQLMAQTGRRSGGPKLLSFSGVVEDSVQLLRATALRPGVTVQTGFAQNLPAVRADEAQLRQVVANLVSNAVESIGGATGAIRVTTFQRHLDAPALARLQFAEKAAPGDFVALEVSDMGCGMEPEVLARIFEPVFTTKAAGRGLGLPAVATIVRQHHGALSVESVPARGTTFQVYFPAAGSAVEPVRTVDSRPPAGAGAILVVDDDDVVRALAKWVVERAGHRVVTARDGDEALALFRADPGAFRLVLLDLTMPRMSGEEVLVGMRAVRPNVPVVLITGHGEDMLRAEEKAGVLGFLQKPFTPEVLRAVLQKHVASSGSASPVAGR